MTQSHDKPVFRFGRTSTVCLIGAAMCLGGAIVFSILGFSSAALFNVAALALAAIGVFLRVLGRADRRHPFPIEGCFDK